MTPRQFSWRFSRDSRLASGRYFSAGPVRVSRGDRIGVVLLNLGGPHSRGELETFLYRRWMDPVVEKTRFRPGRHSFVRLAAKLGSRSLWRDYEQIGGECPINRRSHEQAAALQECLNGAVASRLGITFRTYLAMRYGTPSSEDAMRALVRDEVTKTILLPLYPQYAIATTGSSLAYWAVMSQAQRQDTGTTAVLEYAAHPDYIQSLSERIDEALQRFPKRVRPATHIVFCAKSHTAGNALDAEESFCRLMHESIGRVVELRGAKHKHHITFFESGQSDVGSGHEDTRNTIRRLADDGVKSVLLVPIGITTDELWTSYTLDMVLRKEFQPGSIRFFEVASALNCHPLFITALSRVVAQQLAAASDRETGVNVASAPHASAGPVESGAALRAVRACDTCHGPISARQWTPAPTEYRPAAGA